ncbi:MAG: flavodoxin [Oscillospiraceae bacterium]|nr:flavodoxin [Oscillospiraceae bacterium]
MNKKVLVAYFSATGTTADAAKALARAAGAELYEIRPAVPYTAADLNWHDKKSRTTLEMNDRACRPAVADPLPDTAAFDVVYVGFPVWWYTAPRIINTFLEGCSLEGKTVIPFATSGGSGLGKAGEELSAASAPKAKWLPGRLLNGLSEESLRAWAAHNA